MKKVVITSWRAGRARGITVWQGNDIIKEFNVYDLIWHRKKNVRIMDRWHARRLAMEWISDHAYELVKEI